jgi:hypothetical protein
MSSPSVMTLSRLMPIPSSRRQIQHIDDARKIRQDAVVRCADNLSAMCRDPRADRRAELTYSPMRAGFVLAHQSAELTTSA